MNPRPDSNLVTLHKHRDPSAAEKQAYEPHCEKRARLGAIIAIAVACATYLGICWGMGWLDRWFA